MKIDAASSNPSSAFEEGASGRHGRIFVSYSRQDIDISTRLRDRLISEDFDAYLDVHDIAKGESWRERIGDLVQSADSVLFLVSPASIASEICAWEAA